MGGQEAQGQAQVVRREARQEAWRPLTMRTRDRLRHLRALKRRRKRKRRRTRRRRRRRSKRGATVLQEELPNHLDNCSLHSQLPPVDCDLKNKYFVFILSSTFQLKQISITYLRNVCQLHIN